jgi:DnaJ-class molecular chaperone
MENNEVINDILDLTIVKGIFEGQEFTIKGRGHKFKDTRGDLILRIKEVRHPDFTRQSNNPADLTYNLKITLVQSICGFEIAIKGIDNQKLIIKNYKKIIKNGDRKIIKNHGMYVYQKNERGNLNIVFDVIYPIAINDDAKNMIASAFEYDNKSKYVVNPYEYTICEIDN